jgi:hypothetical protein
MDIPQPVAQTPEPSNGKGLFWVLILALFFVLAGGGYFFYSFLKQGAPLAGTPQTITPQEVKGALNDLGSVLYSQSQDPIQDKLPQTVAQLPNPVDSLYQNPFQ